MDTGPLLAMLDKSDRWHLVCSATLRQLRLPLLTSEAVLTELLHLVGPARSDVNAAWRLIHSGALLLAEIQHHELQEIQSLMVRYSDCPMDFADATLVYLAKRESISTVFTTDQGHFAAYRIAGKRPFTILPIDRPR
jgi:predicted nucleic acid-binding protein